MTMILVAPTAFSRSEVVEHPSNRGGFLQSKRVRCGAPKWTSPLTGFQLRSTRPLQTRVPISGDDDVVVHGDAERLGDGDDRAHLDVRASPAEALHEAGPIRKSAKRFSEKIMPRQ
jgi:hypothetical protein